MKSIACFVALLCAACGSSQEPIPASVAQGLTKELGQSLMSALQTAMAEGGPSPAIEVCATQAPMLAKQASGPEYSVRRIGTRVRNVAQNTPTASELKVLQTLTQEQPSFQGQIDGRAVFLQGIFIPNALCLTCHGSPEQIPSEVQEALLTRYPEDQAVGYQLGDLRGAFVVEQVP